MISCNIDPRYRKLKLEAALVSAAEAALEHVGAPADVDLTLVITADARLRKLNRQFRSEAKPTDVLSFPSQEKDPESGQHYLGDVIISLARARAQAKAAGHPLQAELQLLTVHGVLHLLGHDHAAAAEKARMWKAQDAILKKLGLSVRSLQAEELHTIS